MYCQGLNVKYISDSKNIIISCTLIGLLGGYYFSEQSHNELLKHEKVIKEEINNHSSLNNISYQRKNALIGEWTGAFF